MNCFEQFINLFDQCELSLIMVDFLIEQNLDWNTDF